MIMWIILLAIVGVIITIIGIMATLRVVVPTNCADVVIKGNKREVFSADTRYSTEGNAVYYAIPAWVPGLGKAIRRMPLEMLELKVPNFTAFDENRARFDCDIVAFVVVKNAVEASVRMPDTPQLMEAHLSKILQATTRDTTTKKSIRQIINNRQDIIEIIKPRLTESIEDWGLELKNIELIEFKDGPESEVVTNISNIREKEINTEMREKNADQDMKARVKEAETREKAKVREIMQEEMVAKREKEKNKLVFAKEKESKEQELEVTRVELVKRQQIDKEKAEVYAEQQKEVARIEAEKRKEVEAIIKVQKQLQGEGDKLRDEKIAQGKAALEAIPIREKGLAEGEAIKAKLMGQADGKKKLQEVLSKFTELQKEVMVVEEVVEKDKQIGITLGKAFQNADIKLLAGGNEDGFDFARFIESIKVGNPEGADALLNKVARDNDLGFKDWKHAIATIKDPAVRKQMQDTLEKEVIPKIKKGRKIGVA